MAFSPTHNAKFVTGGHVCFVQVDMGDRDRLGRARILSDSGALSYVDVRKLSSFEPMRPVADRRAGR